MSVAIKIFWFQTDNYSRYISVLFPLSVAIDDVGFGTLDPSVAFSHSTA